MPALPRPISDRQVGLARLAVVLTVLAWVAYTITWCFDDLLSRRHASAVGRTEAIAYLLVVTLLTASTLAYLLARLGFFYRVRAHHRTTRAALDEFFDGTTPTLTAIVPSYQEDARVIRNTLLSAALQEYPDKRIVLLIDDPQAPRARRARELLAAAQALPREIQELLAGPAARFTTALDTFESAAATRARVGPEALGELAKHYDAARSWLEELAAAEDIIDHTDAFFANEVLRRLASDLGAVGRALHRAVGEGASLPQARVRQLYRRLAWTFRAELSSFERKRYVSLSHEPNKAMNLNSYIGLMGGKYREVQTVAGPALVPAGPGEADLVVPNCDYVLTLDADSVLLPEYCLRLVHLLEQYEHRQVAIAQTPYSAFPGSATRLERIAGATTDLQHIVHQGLTYYDATFWVGANAVIRKRALDDIATTSYLGDWEVRSYIKDRTVIEDTESTVDLGMHAWRLFNYPERLSYSATPPDFGSLCIQRRRWANGGLLILPKLHRQARARKARGERPRFAETFLRWNYMASITWSSVSLVVLLAFPFNATLISPLLGLVALPYFLAMAADLRYCGYKRLDVARIYGFNLVLLPVNLAGSVSSVIQGITASKAAFARTPKVRNRTVSPLWFLVAPYLLAALAGLTFYYAYLHGRRENMAYAALNVALTIYAIIAFIGLRNSLVDAWVHFKSVLYKPAEPRRRFRRAKRAIPPPAPGEWRSVLQLGTGDPGQWSSTARAAAAELSVERRPGYLPERDEFHIVFQPVVDLASGGIPGYEALTRFYDGMSAQRCLADAVAAGTGTALEALLARAAVEASRRLPADAWLALKASPRLLRADPSFAQTLALLARPVVVEVTEPSTSDLAPELRELPGVLAPNVALAVEHAGFGHKSLTILIELKPAYLKFDRGAIAGLVGDRAKQLQLSAMVRLAEEVGTRLIAAGVEADKERQLLKELGVHCAQGYLLGRPGELVDA